MFKVPFHRRALLWTFVVMFFVVAPSVVFYTAGYRWNPKKNAIERNGTLILDTTPAAANVSLNDEVYSDKTPVTIQNVAPGTYRIRFDKQGYHSWEKTLEVRPEYVTFVNDVQLWPVSDPALVLEASSTALSVSPSQRVLAYLASNATGTNLTFLDLVSNDSRSFAIKGAQLELPVQLDWNDLSSAVLVTDAKGTSWVAARASTESQAMALPAGTYRWGNGVLTGISGRERLSYTVLTGAAAHDELPTSTVDEVDTYSLMTTTGTGLVVSDLSRKDRLYTLPEGNWHFAERINGILFLSGNDVWLGFDAGSANPVAFSLPTSAKPDAVKRKDGTYFLSRHDGELWIMRLGDQPELLLRDSEPITGSSWFRTGNNVFYSTHHDVVALGIDSRDGRVQTTLASFDDIQGMTLGKKELYVSGTRAGKTGVWKIVVE
jgi:hypothetical protein